MNRLRGITTEARQVADQTTDIYKFSLVKRWQAVKDLLPHLIVEDGRVYVITSMADPWGSRNQIRWSDLDAMIVQAEAKLETRKGPAKEIGSAAASKKDQRA